MSTDTAIIAGVQFIEQRPTHDTNIEYWLARCGDRLSEVFLLPLQHRDRLNSLPNLIGFTQCKIVEADDQLAVIMPGIIQIPTTQMLQKIGVTGCVGMAWHIADMLSLLHQSGRSHNLLHPESIGLNDLGELEIRPSLGRFIPFDPDPKASAIATDCWQMRQVIQHLGISEKVDPLFALLNRGLQEEFARLRLQPATAIRQSIAAVLARHSEWEEKFVEQMGSNWALNQRNLQESTIIPHRLKSIRPTLSMDNVKDMADSIDLWGNLFTSSSIDEVSSSQALLLEGLSGKESSKESSFVSKIQLPTHLGEPIEEDTTKLEIDLVGPTSIQVPVQAKRSGLVSIQEVGINEVSDIEEQDFYHGFSAIVEETADDLEAIHRRRRRSQSRREINPHSQNDTPPSLFEEKTEVITPPRIEEAFDQTEALIAEDSILSSHLEEVSADAELTQLIQPDSIAVKDSISIAIEAISVDEEAEQLVETSEQKLETLQVDEAEVSDLALSALSPIVEISSVDEECLDSSEEDSPVDVIIGDSTAEESTGLQMEDPSDPVEQIFKPVIEPKDSTPEPLGEIVADTVGSPSHIEEERSKSSEEESKTIFEQYDVEPEELSSDQIATDETVDSAEIRSVEQEEVELSIRKENVESTWDVEDEVEDKSNTNEGESVLVEVSFSEEDPFSAPIPSLTPPSEVFLGDEDSTEANKNIVSEYIVQENNETIEEYSEALESEEYVDDEESFSDSEELEEVSEEPETTSPVSIHNMPLVSIVEEDDFSVNEPSEESEDDAGVSIQFLMEVSEPPINIEHFDEVFEGESSSSTASPSSESGFVANLSLGSSTISTSTLDVEEPLADIEFPSIEEVRAQDQTFAGDVNDLFDSSEPAVVKSSHTLPSQLTQSSATEPKWTGATSFDNLTDADDALGDEKYAYAQVELGDVDAVLGESIRDFSELERRGSPWGLLLIISLVMICAIVYVLSLDPSSPTEVETVVNRDVPPTPILQQVEIQTDPPRGTVLIDSNSLGIAPVKWDIEDGDVFLMCVDWGSNPVCRRVPRSDLQTATYTFTRRLTP